MLMHCQTAPGGGTSAGWLACLGLYLLAAAGCHQTGRYDASNLPAQLIAPRVGSLQQVDLSQLARSVGNNHVLYPGDLVEVTVATGLESETPPNYRGRVGQDGSVDVPLIGTVRVAGLEVTQAEQVIRDESIRRGLFVDPNVTVVLSKRRANRVTVVGSVREPGTYEVPASSSDLLTAIVMAGGLTEEAGTIVEVRHPPQAPVAAQHSPGTASLAGYPPASDGGTAARTVQVDLENTTSVPPREFQLEDGATVMVMPRPARYVHVIGLVRNADQFEIPEGQELHLLQAIALAGGRTVSIADKVHVIRPVPGQSEPVLIEASIREAKQGKANIRLAAGDVVSVEETPATFIVETIRSFVRFGFTSGIPGI